MGHLDYAHQLSVDDGQFAIAKVNGTIKLVQVSLATPASALTTVDVKIFRHEFIHIFRYAECRTLHPADVHIIELIDDHHKSYEEENDTVFLAKNVMERMSKLTSRAPFAAHPQHVSRMRRR
ncbi:hypothetical protein DFH07DRAFT_748498 [Mycena maculata]|uniref:Uncharacterized protein n=1 Tax=Mycena maculata TaxID=230809 RepID=A0AAD7INX1_9AGAR|nr:hypothetical protein DFH07DRAFT_748498 [Mycena maculata]